jgi:hypothetical protein
MTLQEEVTSFQKRIAQAEAKRDAWRAAGDREKYLEAFFEVEGMELLLERYLQQHAVREAPDSSHSRSSVASP